MSKSLSNVGFYFWIKKTFENFWSCETLKTGSCISTLVCVVEDRERWCALMVNASIVTPLRLMIEFTGLMMSV